jgi:hypothetical protein
MPTVRHGKALRDVARHREAWQGKARLGLVRHGEARFG